MIVTLSLLAESIIVDTLLEVINDGGEEEFSEAFLDWFNSGCCQVGAVSDVVEESYQKVENFEAPDVVVQWKGSPKGIAGCHELFS
ncbi:hypothetical protein QJS04_geneDACA019919 [Acorus gramineus]|uniref:Uncharacterized protein n=1 Tax=Acorus gramineus TaxID=55184 RepID=A0AAV9AIR4_ACOGR|nr:hypothetical protein QJS04_geneDACA019919 [Acorus gramineus]